MRRLGAFFLSEFEESEILEEVRKKAHAANLDDKSAFVLSGSECADLVLKYYDDETRIVLGSAWKEFLQSPLVNDVTGPWREDFEYLEHLTSSYFRFLDSRLMHSIMIVQNCSKSIAIYLGEIQGRLITKDRKRLLELGVPPPLPASKELDAEYLDRMNAWLDHSLHRPLDTELEEMYKDELTKEIRLLMKELINANALIGVDITWVWYYWGQ